MFLYVGIRTYVLARAMACDCSEVDRDPFGSGKPSLGLKKLYQLSLTDTSRVTLDKSWS